VSANNPEEAGDSSSAAADGTAQSPSAWLFRPTHTSGMEAATESAVQRGTGAHLFSLTRSMLKLKRGVPDGVDLELGSIDEREENDLDVLMEPLVSNTLASHARSILHHRTPEKSNGDELGQEKDDRDQVSPISLQGRMAFLRDLAQHAPSPSKLRLNGPLPSPVLPSAADQMTKAIASEYQSYEDWFRVKRLGIRTMFGYSLFLMIPAVAVSSILFYGLDNPPCQNPGACVPPDESKKSVVVYLGSASASWWILFVCCRQLITAMVAKATEDVLVDYFALQSTWSLSLFGPHVTLFIVLARGWPVRVFLWGLYDILFLYGKHSFAQHWLFYQDVITMMNDKNPDGGITGTTEYLDFLIIAMILSVFAAAKRVWLGLVLGRNTYREFGVASFKWLA
jgi:hypothetical protein